MTKITTARDARNEKLAADALAASRDQQNAARFTVPTGLHPAIGVTMGAAGAKFYIVIDGTKVDGTVEQLTEKLAQQAELEFLTNAIEHAPAARPTPSDLKGHWTPVGYFVCAPCASRILGRGCSLPKGSAPSWDGEPYGVCVLCTPIENLAVQQ